MKRILGTVMPVVLLVQLALTVALVNKASAQSAGKDPDNENQRGHVPIGRYSSWLESLGPEYEVVQGEVFLMTNTECPKFVAIFDSCFGQNPAAPYIIPQPPIEVSYVDPDYATTFNTPGPHHQTANIFYRLGDQDALVTIVSYPPKAAYLAYTSYVFTRKSSNYKGVSPPRPPTVSPDPDRYEIFGSMGNGVNNVTVQNQLGVSPWDNATVAYITTSNKILATTLVENAEEQGIDPKSIFVEPIGSNVITGNGPDADDVITLMRYAVPESATASNGWMSSLRQNVRVYKVSSLNLPVQRYGEIDYTPHIVNNAETTYLPSLSAALNQLASVLQNYLTAKQFPSETESRPLTPTTDVNAQGIPDGGLVGAVCIQYGTNCLGDEQDTSTYAYLPLRRLDLEETAFVVGVNHNVPSLNNTRYVSVGVYNGDNASGVASASQTNPHAAGFDSGSLSGSAQGILQALGISIPPEYTSLIANLPTFYVTAVARNINNPAIAAARQYTIDLQGISLIPENAPLTITERSYVVPGTTTGGNVDYMLYPIVVAGRRDFVPQGSDP